MKYPLFINIDIDEIRGFLLLRKNDFSMLLSPPTSKIFCHVNHNAKVPYQVVWLCPRNILFSDDSWINIGRYSGTKIKCIEIRIQFRLLGVSDVFGTFSFYMLFTIFLPLFCKVCKNTLNPSWKLVEIPMAELCNSDYDRKIKVSWWVNPRSHRVLPLPRQWSTCH